MKRLLLKALVLLCFGASAHAQFTTITASKVYQNASGKLLPSGRVHFQPNLSVNNQPASFKVSGGGQGTVTPVDCLIVNGAITTQPDGSACQLADSTLTNPINLGYRGTLTNAANQQLWGPGYELMQPSGTSWSVDTFVPNVSNLVPSVAGPTGPQGPPFDMQGAWSSTVSYTKGQVVTSGNVIYISNVTPNLNNNPSTSPTQWTPLAQPSSLTLLGVASFSALQSAVSVCGSTTCAIVIGANIAATSSINIPSNITLIFAGGMLQPAANVYIQVAGPVVAPLVQIFGGTGYVYGLMVARPEWFGPSATVLTAIAAVGTGGRVMLEAAAYQSGMAPTNYPPTYSHFSVIGAGQAALNSGNTAFTAGSGTIIKGMTNVRGSFQSWSNLSIDNGSALNTCTDGLTVSSGGINQPQLTDIAIDHVSTLLCAPSTAYHSVLIEGVTGATVSNVQTTNGIYGVVLKCMHCTAQHVVSRAHSSNCFLIKSDNTFATAAYVDADDIQCSSLTAGDTGPPQILGAAATVQKVTLRNLKATGMSGVGLSLYSFALSGANGAVADVDVVNPIIDTVPSGTGIQTISDSTSTVTRVNISNPTINNVNAAMLIGQYGSQIAVSNATMTNVAANGIDNQAANSVFINSNCSNVAGFCGYSRGGLGEWIGIHVQPSGGGVAAGPAYGADSGMIDTFLQGNIVAGTVPFINASGLYRGATSISIASLNTAVPLPGSSTGSGMLRLRDSTSGGAALFLLDPNGGAQLIGTSQIIGITSAAAITQASGNWNVTISAGSTPRTLSFTFYQ